VPARAAFPGRIPKVDNVDLASLDLASESADSAGFAGFRPEDIQAPQGLAKLLRRNEFLNRAEALAAIALLASSGIAEASAFDISERILYIVSCVSNSLCLRCALVLIRMNPRLPIAFTAKIGLWWLAHAVHNKHMVAVVCTLIDKDRVAVVFTRLPVC
jgi:hypothetical protein